MYLSLTTAAITYALYSVPVLLLLFCGIQASVYGHFEDNPDEISPHIEWVPIVQRNFTDIINEALHEDYEEKVTHHHREHSQRQKERLIRIGKMLNASYQNMERDAKAGKEKILRLEEQQRQRPTASSEPVSTAAAQFITFTLPNLLLFFFMYSLCR